MEVVEIKRMPHALDLPLPRYQSAWAAGLDLPAGWDRRAYGQSIMLRPGCPQTISTGLAISIPEGHVGLIRGRSGLAFKHNVFAFEGTLDADYRGELKVLLVNHGKIGYPDMNR